jgi:alkylresorcinol/alkylpyrone synthase
MGWQLRENGFGVLFSRDIPDLVMNDFPDALYGFLRQHGREFADIDHIVPHPGGAKVLSAMASSLNIGDDALLHARGVLRDFGNMSAASVFFVLERCLAAGAEGRFLLSALGPGFTAGFTLLENKS